jgi:O-antigen ligase
MARRSMEPAQPAFQPERRQVPIVLRNFALLSLFIHLASLAATQTAYGAGFSMLRWISLFAFAGFATLASLNSSQKRAWLKPVYFSMAIYAALWGFTVLYGEYPLFSGYRWGAHILIVMSGLVFLPRILRMSDALRLLTMLKAIVAVILVVSYFAPAPLTVFDDTTLYRGILGNANALGHMSAVGCLLFLHGYLSRRGTRWGYIQLVLAALAGLLLIRSGARSSLVAFTAGFFVLYLYYAAHLSRYVIAGLVAGLVALIVFPNVSEHVGALVFKGQYVSQASDLERLTNTRTPAWDRSWASFKQRPLLGWGFGVDSDTDVSTWDGEWSSLGVTVRDPVNDIMYTLESGGVVGLFAYFFLMSLIIKAWCPRLLRSRLNGLLRGPGYAVAASAHEAQKAFFCLSVMLFVLFEFDNTALAAGNFFAALAWVTFGLALGVHGMLMSRLRNLTPVSMHPRQPAVLPEVRFNR